MASCLNKQDDELNQLLDSHMAYHPPRRIMGTRHLCLDSGSCALCPISPTGDGSCRSQEQVKSSVAHIVESRTHAVMVQVQCWLREKSELTAKFTNHSKGTTKIVTPASCGRRPAITRGMISSPPRVLVFPSVLCRHPVAFQTGVSKDAPRAW